MKTDRWFFTLVVPVAWATLSLLHFQFPGDEYGLWAVSSLAGTWIAFLLPNIGDIHQPWIRLSVASVGGLVMSGAGWALWRLRVPKVWWLALWLVVALVVLVLTVGSYPNLEQALRKNGSWTAYILSALLLGMYAATLVAGMVALFRRPTTVSFPTRA